LPKVKTLVLRISLLILFSTSLAGGHWYIHNSNQKKQSPIERVALISVFKAKSLFDQKEAVFIDTRPHQAYVQEHIPGAIHFSLRKFGSQDWKNIKSLSQQTPLIVYCEGGRCRSSLKMAKLLQQELGFLYVRAFVGGWQLWKLLNYPVVSGQDPQ